MSRPPDSESRGPRDPLPPAEPARFEDTVLPHLDSAYNLARYLLHDEHDAEDAVQDACLRALRYFAGFRGGNARAWLLTIVRHACYTRRRREWPRALTTEFDEELHGAGESAADPEPAHERAAAGRALHGALERLPVKFREVLVLRELEGLSYKEICAIVRVPIGTVMSRLARARAQLQAAVTGGRVEGAGDAM